MNTQTTTRSDYLFELGTEELPPKSLLTLAESLKTSITESFSENKLSFENFELFCTPRRLAFLVRQLDDQTPKSQSQVWGPPAKIAFDDNGEPTKAALAFCDRNGIQADQLQVASDGKADKLFCNKVAGGDAVSALLPTFIQDALAALPIAKRMRWGASRTEFVRPVHWLVLLKDSEVIPADILGLNAGSTTLGHRFHCDVELNIESPTQYASILKEQGKVIADFSTRRSMIKEQVNHEAHALGGNAVIDDDLLDEVTALVEWPVAISGKFEERFLSVPAEALVSSMKEHQKYFHLEDNSGQLMPHFITVSNIQSDDYSAIKSGNEKVIRPRLADAAFFFETDLKQSLESRREKLKSVVFQSKLGSVFDKTERIAKLAGYIAETLSLENVDLQDLHSCASLCKSDLVSNMVYEFPELQGIAGHHYAINDGHATAVAIGIEEHYQPKFAGDALPSTDIGSIVGLADRLDTLTGIFGIGQLPTGSKDPFALRRASVSVLRIIVEKNYELDLADLISYSASLHSSALPKQDELLQTAVPYVLDRLKAGYEDTGISPNVMQAVAAKELATPVDIDKRVKAVAAFYKTDDAIALAAANKRVANILAKLDGEAPTAISSSLFVESEETQLHEALSTIKTTIAPLLQKRDYESALKQLSCLRPLVDAYFDQVMVMADDLAIRNNRLALLNSLRTIFLDIADIRFLAPSK